MKHLLLLALLLLVGLGQTAAAQTPIDTTGGRYFRPVFPTVNVTSNVVFGSASDYLGNTQMLRMDIYEPAGDVSPERPVIIFAHQGGFILGSKTDAYMIKVCTQFAKLGYVTASIDYRLGFVLTGLRAPADTPQVARAAIRGMQDLRAAVRFFRADAAGANLYRASASRIAVGGSSAGAFAALEVGYLDKASEVPTYVGLAALGGIEGNSGNPGFNSFPLAVLNLSGATEQPSAIEPGNVPLYSAHGTADATVPYFQGRVGSFLPPKYVYGSGRLNAYASTIGVPNVLRRFSQAGHVPFESTSAAGLAYADTVYRDIRAFLRPLLAPFAAAYPSLVINTNTAVPAGSYQDITVNSGTATLGGNVTVYGTLVVKSLTGQPAGALNTNCFVVDGPGNFDLQDGAALRICDPAGISASGATGAVRNTGSRTFSADAVYTYTGNGSQATGTGLPATVRELEVAIPAANALTLNSAVRISQRLVPTSGTLNNSQQALTLLSAAAGTALITPGPGVVNGQLTVQRYLDPSANPGPGYRHLTMPLTNTDANVFSTPGFTPTLTTAYNSSARPDLVTPFPTLFGYDQQRAVTSPATSYTEFDKGWFVANIYTPGAPPNSNFVRGRGFTVNMPAGQTLSALGTLTGNNVSYSALLGAAATPTAGWHLLGNPYASALNWDNVPIPAGMSGAMYIFVSSSQYGGQYRSYVNGLGGAGSTIPLGQGFFVRSLASSFVTFTIPLAARITDFAAANTATVQRPTADVRPRLHLMLAATTPAVSPADEAILYLEAGATAAPDLRYDAVKLPNSTGLNLATVAAGEELAINGLPMLTAATVVPLALTVPAAGTYTLHAAQLLNFAPGTALTLTDALTGTRTLLAAGTRYAFSMSGLAAPGRFALELRPANVTATTNPAQALAAQLQVYPNPATERLQMALPAGVATGTVSAWLTNVLGQTVQRQQLPVTAGQGLRAEIDMRGLAPGVYQLHLTVAGTALVRRVVVE
jgi:hypothetical protein